MKRDYYVAVGLKRIHEEMHQQLLAANSEARRLRTDMAHAEHVIKMLRPHESMVPLSIKRRYARLSFFKRG